MPAVNRVLIVGGGTGGHALAVLLARAGVTTDIVELAPDGHLTSGSGITLQGNALRVLRDLGVWQEVRAHGHGFTTIGLTALDGSPLGEIEDIQAGGPDLPATFGMRRPDLQRVLSAASRAAGATLRTGLSVASLRQDPDGVDVTLTDGTTARYDLVVGADGLNSSTRRMIDVPDRPTPTGMGIWRTTASRPRELVRTTLTYGGPCFIAGLTPTGEDSLYAFLVEPARERRDVERLDRAREMRRLAEPYGGMWEHVRDALADTEPERVNYTWFHRLLVEGPWHRERVVLLGDAAHACPPTIAQGAAMSLEDAQVLAELLTADDGAPLPKLLTAYRERRLPRVRMVVDASVQIGQWLLDGVRDADVPGLIARTMTALTERP